MFKNTFQSGFLSILYSIGSKPLQIWEKQVMSYCIRSKCRQLEHPFFDACPACCAKVRNGHIKRITDNDIQSLVIEIVGTNVR